MNKPGNRQPATRNSFRMPAEWEPHTATWLAWPHNKNDWPGKFEPVPWAYGEIIRYLSKVERVGLLVKDESQRALARGMLKRAGVNLKQIDFLIVPTDRVWTRDSGPIFVVNDETKSTAALNWKFTAWAKYPNHKLDNDVPLHIAEFLDCPVLEPMHKGKRVVLEGGAIDVNGKGSLLTTEECLLSKKTQVRNPGFTRKDYEQVFEKYLGVTNTIWLGNGIVGDDTHGHVDDLARFTDASTVVTVAEKDKSDPNYKPLQDNVKRLEKARDQDGKKLRVVELPMPRPLVFEGTRLPASYANFLIANDLVLVPTFNDSADREALSILAELFKGREVVGIHCVDFVWGFGTIHCASQQQPA